MTTTVLRYRCDLCGTVWLMRGQVDLCEMACAELAQAGDAGTAETTKIGSVHEHAVAKSNAPEGNAP